MALWSVGLPSVGRADDRAPGARARVAVLALRGDRDGALRDAAQASFAKDARVEVLRRKALDEGLESRDLSENAAPRDLTGLASDLRIDAFITGEVVRKRRKLHIRLRVHRADTGEAVGGDAWVLRPDRAEGIVEGTAAERLHTYIVPVASKAPRAKWLEAKDIDEEELEDVADDEDDGADSRWSWLSVALLGGTLHRSMAADAVVSNNGRDPAGPAEFTEERAYESSGIGHVELGVEAVFYPGAIGDNPVFPYAGLVARFRHSLFLSTDACRERTPPSTPCTDSDRFTIGTSAYELYLGARGRYPLLGEGIHVLEGLLDVGYRQFVFDLDRADLLKLERFSVVPAFAYRSLAVALGADYGVFDSLKVGASVGYHFGLGIGEDAREIWGVDSTGGGGLDLELRGTFDLSSVVADGVFVRLDLAYFHFTSDIAGQTVCVDAPCDDAVNDRWEAWPSESGDPNAVTGGIKSSVTDHYFRWGLALGYQL